ncbi:hypothetical protein R84B8_01443 [Treponema sp. R8-4-B8]
MVAVISLIAEAVSFMLLARSLPVSDNAAVCSFIETINFFILASVLLKYRDMSEISSFPFSGITRVKSPSPSEISFSVSVTLTIGLVTNPRTKKKATAVAIMAIVARITVNVVISFISFNTWDSETPISTVHSKSEVPILIGLTTNLKVSSCCGSYTLPL